MTGTSLQRRCAQIATGDGPVTPAAREMVERSIRDAVAVALAGADQQSVQVAKRFVAAQGAAGPAWIWGTDQRVDPQSAALVNGTAVQALEYDDIAQLPAAHMSSVLVPTMSALADRIDPARAVDGIVHGLRAGTLVSEVIAREAYRRGLQPTHTIGPLSAVCAAGYGMGLDVDRIADAIGLVAIQAMGLRAHTGTRAKAMQSGLASAAAVRSVLLAVEGAEAGADALDSVLRLFGVPDETIADVAAREEVEPLFLAVKLYPTCGAAHTAIEGTLAAREALGADGSSATSIEVRLPPRMPNSMHFAWPTNPDEARFSLRYCVDVAWRNGRVDPEEFTEDAIARAQKAGISDWITLVGDESFDPGGEECRVTVELDGQVVTRDIEFRDGYIERPLDAGPVEEKLRRCVEPTRGAAKAAEIMATLTGSRAIHSIGEVTAP